jgi:hypothetical protein
MLTSRDSVHHGKRPHQEQIGIRVLKQGAVRGGAGGEFGIGVEEVFNPVSKENFVPDYILRGQKLAGGRRSAVPDAQASLVQVSSLWLGVSPVLYRRCRDRTSDEPTGCNANTFAANLRNARCGKLKALPPCAAGGFMSNIKVFPMAMLPGWPFAPSKTPGAETA